jgi:MFS family permease
MISARSRANPQKEPSRVATLLATTLASFLTPLMGSSINVALPSIGKELRMDAILLGWVATSYLLASSMTLVPIGRLADIYGRKRIFTYGVVTFVVSSALTALSQSAAMLIGFRVLQGIGGAMLFATAVAILTSVFPPEQRGRVLGINAAAVYAGLSVGPFVGGLLTQHLGWRSIFWLNVPLGLIVLAFALWKLHGEWAEARGERLDIVGSAVGAVAFVRWEMKVNSPVLNIALFRSNTIFAMSSLAALINYSATFAVGFLISLYLQYIKDFSPQTAGIVLVTAPVVQAVFSPLAGRLSDRVEPRLIASIGMALSAAGLVPFIFLTKDSGLVFIIASLAVIGFGFALFASPNTNAVMSSVERRYYGVAAAVLATVRQIGMTFSLGIVMLVFAVYLGRVQITPEYHAVFLTSLNIAFIIFAVLCFLGIFASLARGKVRG